MSLALNSGTSYDEEKDEKDSILIAYHANCIDGFTAAWVVYNECKLRGADGIELIGMKYGKDNTKMSPSEWGMLGAMKGDFYNKVYIVDFSVSLACIEEIKEHYKNIEVRIFDHHKTAFERYAPDMIVEKESHFTSLDMNISITLKNDESGASLCWKYFDLGVNQDDSRLPKLIRYVKDYDIWTFEYGDATRHVNKVLKLREQTILSWDNIASSMGVESYMQDILHAGMMLQREHNQRVEKIASRANFCTIAGYNGLEVECAYEYVSDVGMYLADKCGTFGAMYTIDREKLEVKWSLRGVADMDVSHIAKQFGGGGHKGAAGFTVPMIPAVLPMIPESGTR